MMRAFALASALVLCSATAAAAQKPVADEAFAVIRSLYEYDDALPLNARTLQHFDTAGFTREKFVIDGWRGTRIPGLIALPKTNRMQHPVIVLIDGIGGWKERWWQQTSWNRGRVLVDSLLASGFAIVMIDAPASGERTHENDYETAEAFIKKPAQLRDLVIQNVIEHRRVIDYLETRADIDTARVGMLGLSLGGMTTFFLGSVDSRVKAGVTGVTPLWRFGPVTSAANYAPRVTMPMLMLMGRRDSYYTSEQVAQVYASLASRHKEVVWYDVGHRLPEEYAAAAADWFRRHLEPNGDHK